MVGEFGGIAETRPHVLQRHSGLQRMDAVALGERGDEARLECVECRPRVQPRADAHDRFLAVGDESSHGVGRRAETDRQRVDVDA